MRGVNLKTNHRLDDISRKRCYNKENKNKTKIRKEKTMKTITMISLSSYELSSLYLEENRSISRVKNEVGKWEMEE